MPLFVSNNFPFFVQVLDEEKENLPVTSVDDIAITFDDHDFAKNPPPPALVPSLPPSSYKSDPTSAGTTHVKNSTSAHLPEKSTPSLSPVIPKGPNTQDKLPAPDNNGLQKHGSAQEQPSKDKTNTVDDHLQRMFLESVPQINNRSSTASVISSSSTQSQQLRFYPPPMMEKTRNGFNNPALNAPAARSASNAPHSSFREGQLRRFVAPPSSPAVGGDDEKHKCCVIL